MGAHGAQVLRAPPLSLLLGVLVLAACGGGTAAPEQAAPPAAVLKQAVAKLEQAGSLRFTVEGTWRDRDLGGGPLAYSGKGVVRFSPRQGWIWLDMRNVLPRLLTSGLPARVREDARRYWDDPEGWQVEIRVVGKREWDRIPALSLAFGTKEWIRFDDTPENSLKVRLGTVWQNPIAVAAYLRALGRVERVGTETVGDRETTHYRSRVRLGRLSSPVRADRAQLRRSIRQVIGQTGRKTLPIEVWVDEEGLPRRIRFVDVSPRGPGDRAPATIRATMEIAEYGVDFSVLRPPARKVMTEAEFDRAIGR